jgi:outer membrane biogenesis lipoprotein LolB
MISKAARLALTATAALLLLAACTAPAPDCTGKVGNSKKECAAESTTTRSPDNANNPDNSGN